MSKKTFLWILLELMFLILFNTIFFAVAGVDHPVAVWVSYVFMHLSLVLIIVTAFLLRKSDDITFLGIPRDYLGAGYFFIEFFIGLLIIFTGSDSFKGAFVIQIIIAAAYSIILLAMLIVHEYASDKKAKEQEESETEE